MAVTDIAARYTPVVSWFYDRVAADAVLSAVAGLIGRVQTSIVGGGAVLEVGCGGGQFAHRLVAAHPTISVTGVDLSVEQIARAVARSNRLPPTDANRIHFRAGSALALPFADNSFDAVVSIASVKHWPDRRRGVAEMARVLKEGGLLLAAETDRGCHLADARRFARNTHLPAPLRVPYLWMFRTYIAGQGLDLDDARELIDGQALIDTTVARIVGAPFLVCTGRKHVDDRSTDIASMPTSIYSLDP